MIAPQGDVQACTDSDLGAAPIRLTPPSAGTVIPLPCGSLRAVSGDQARRGPTQPDFRAEPMPGTGWPLVPGAIISTEHGICEIVSPRSLAFNPKLYNKHHGGAPPLAINIMRPGKWSNRFEIGRDGDRAEVVAKHERDLADQPELLKQLDELRGRDLLCCCAPHPCHGDILLKLANASREERVAWWRATRAKATL
jgi:Domain of unknown function (DUF4326)